MAQHKATPTRFRIWTRAFMHDVPRRRTAELGHAGPRTRANPRLHGKSGALPGVGCSDLVRQSKVHRLKISDLPLSPSTVETGQAAVSCPNPLCVSAPLRLCVESGAIKTQRRKDAKSQGIKPTRARRRTREISHAGPDDTGQPGTSRQTSGAPRRWLQRLDRRCVHKLTNLQSDEPQRAVASGPTTALANLSTNRRARHD